jgi:hypothetical protein
MGFWKWLSGKRNGVEVVDRIWLNQDAKFRGLCKEIQDQLPTTPVFLGTAHFPATLARLRVELAQSGLTHRDQANALSSADLLGLLKGGHPPPLILVQADALVPDEFPAPLVGEAPAISMVVAERHFLRVRDERLVDFARGLARRCRLSFHLALDDPLTRIFAGEWIGQTLRNLGMTESEPIENAMIGRRIKQAQAKVAKRVMDERKADSAEDWLQSNLP